MEKNKKIIKLCYLQIAFYVVFLTSLLLHFKRGLDHRAFALLIILTLLGCASALTLTDYLKSLIRRSGFDGHEEGDVFIQTFASYLTRILTEDSFLRGSAVMNLSLCRIMQPGTSWSR